MGAADRLTDAERILLNEKDEEFVQTPGTEYGYSTPCLTSSQHLERLAQIVCQVSRMALRQVDQHAILQRTFAADDEGSPQS